MLSHTELQLRRSTRSTRHLDSANGRNYLASKVACSQAAFEIWLVSAAVMPHLQSWYNLCIRSRSRFTEALGWIDEGESGYYYSKSGLEQDLLGLCQGATDISGQCYYKAPSGAPETAHNTSSWSTQDIWARAAWRIAESSPSLQEACRKNGAKTISTAYAIAIEVIVVAFHSIACRGSASVWESLINDFSFDAEPAASECEKRGSAGPSSVSLRSGLAQESSVDVGVARKRNGLKRRKLDNCKLVRTLPPTRQLRDVNTKFLRKHNARCRSVRVVHDADTPKGENKNSTAVERGIDDSRCRLQRCGVLRLRFHDTEKLKTIH